MTDPVVLSKKHAALEGRAALPPRPLAAAAVAVNAMTPRPPAPCAVLVQTDTARPAATYTLDSCSPTTTRLVP